MQSTKNQSFSPPNNSLGSNTNSSLLANRIVWVDICRVICMLCILVQHSGEFLPSGYHNPWHGIIMGAAYDFTRPILPVLVFFFLSGWLQKANNKYIEWKKPLLLFAPAIVFWNLIQLCIQTPPCVTWSAIVGQLGICFSTNANGPLWFLHELMFYTLLLPLIHRIPVHFRIVVIICCLWLGNSYRCINEGWGITSRANDIGFFIAGTILHNTNKEAIFTFLRKTSIWFVPVTLYLVFGKLLPAPFTFTPMSNLNTNGLSPVVGFMSMCGLSIIMSSIFPRISGMISNSSAAIFFIYASHWPAFTLYKQIATIYEIPPPPPLLYPLVLILYMVCGTAIWRLATLTHNRWLLSVVFLQSSQKK